MNESGKFRLAGLLLAGFIVLAAPLLFFNSLLTTALQRTEDSKMGLLREKMLQEAERIKELLKPAAYIKETIRKVHSEILPEVTRDLIKLRPAKDFGRDIFDKRLPESFLTALRSHRLEPWFITVTYPEIAAVHYWFSKNLREQCPEQDNLAASIAYKLISVSARLYRQYYQRDWAGLKIKAGVSYLMNFGFREGGSLSIRYLTRFGEFFVGHDTVEELFTDYFGKQSSYFYAYNCLSHENLHGAYMIGVLQSEIMPSEILKTAFEKSYESIEASMVNLTEGRSGFFASGDSLEYFDRPPTEFLNHFFFTQRWAKKRYEGSLEGCRIRLRAEVTDEVKDMRRGQLVFRISAGCLFLAYLMTAIHYWLFGLRLNLTIRRKLLLLLSIIIFIPIIGTGLLTLVSLMGSDRVIENHVLEKTQEVIEEFIQYDDENELRQQIAALEIKRRLEEYDRENLDPKAILSRQSDNLFWLRSLMGNHTILSENGNMVHFSNTLTILTRDSHKLLNVIMPKFLRGLGILKKGGNAFAETLTLGIFEDYITAEVEENSIPHETTVQHDISQTVDTGRAITVLARLKTGSFVFSYSRPMDGNYFTHAYLGKFASSGNKWFSRSDPYCDIDIGARLRRHYQLEMEAWPTNTLLNDEMLESFNRAMELKDSGQRILHTKNGIKTSVWSHRPKKACLFAAIGESRGRGIGFLTISMLFPLLTGYAIVLIMVLSLLFAEFIVKPVSIFSEGIAKLNQEQYGVSIEKFSGDEFSLMTSAFNKMSAALRQREMIKRLVSKKLIERVETADSSTPGRTDKQHICVLASDIRGFTTISEKHSPTEIIELLNSYFTAMEEAINQNAGVIDKYIGDAIQAVFYEKAGLDSAEKRACLAALSMRQKLLMFNQQRAEKKLFALENGIGIASGEAISGSIGSENGRKDFTIIGRITEQAAALESATVQTNSRILVCSATHCAVENEFSFNQHADGRWELTDVG
ncbi:MAG: hypothetical protein KKB51_16270 [Candidatus Riflebacteria bacterium]|nr:hypothetical protein [Candidatus Riflebacteria bacterium]